MSPRALVAILGGSASLGCADLAPTRDVRATIVDAEGRPIPGAVFYVEVADETGPVAYQWAIAGRAGEVPDSAREPMKVPWRRGARLAMAAFAPGRRPAVLTERHGRIVSDGAVLQLDPGDGWDADLELLRVPFAPGTPLALRFERESEAPLRDALRAAWASRQSGAATPESSR